MADTILESCLSCSSDKVQVELDYFRQEFNALLALLPDDSAKIRANSSTIMDMLQTHTDEMTAICSCLMAQHNELGRREQLLAAVNFMAAKLITDTDWQEHISSILARLGKAAEVDRVYIFQDYYDAEGKLCTRQKEKWVAETLSDEHNHSHLRTQPYKEAGFGRWIQMLKTGRPVFGNIDTFPLSEQSVLKRQNIKSLLVMPIEHQNRSWGFIGFDNCRSQKQWETVELDTLRTAANILGSAINQQRTKDELLEKERTYKLIMDASKDGCWIVDDQLQTLEVNSALSEMIQRDKGEIEKACLRDFIHPDSRQEVERVVSGDATPGEEIDIKLASDNHILPATIHISRLEGHRQEKSKTFIFVRDQTDLQKMTEMNAALVESNDRLHGITDLARDAIILLDIRGHIYFWNPAATQIFGYSADEVMGEDLHRIFCMEREYQVFKKDFHHFLSPSTTQGTSAHVREFKVFRKDGTHVWVEVSFAASKHSAERIIVGVCRDISERRQAQLALEKSEKKYMYLANKFSAVLDAIPDGLIELTSCKKVRWANKAAQTMFGLGKDTPILTCPCFFDNKTKTSGCIAMTTFKTGEKQQVQTVTDDGRTFAQRSFPLYDEEGNIDSVVVSISDISLQLQLEATAARTAHLTSLGILAAGVAHEINNPNNFIMLNAPLIAEACHDAIPMLDSFYQEHGEFYLGGLPYSEFREKGPLLHQGILDGSHRIAAIVSHLKEFSSQDKQSAFVPMEINDLVARGVQLVRNQIRKSTSALQLDLAKQLPTVKGNPGQIEQIIINLLMNAAESLPGTTAAIVLSTAFDSKKKMVLIKISDEGCGIAPDDLKKITQPFFTTKLENGGSGLGLSVSQSLVAQHGGVLDIQSQPGKGTTVIVSLPTC